MKDKATAVLVIHEIFGLTDWVRGVADQLAAAGYIAIAPELLSGTAPGGGGTAELGSGDAVRKAIQSLAPDQITADLDAVVDYVAKLPACNGKVVVAGFCWGGSQSFRFATNNEKIKAAFPFYGSGPENEADLARIACPVYGFYGGNDARDNSTIPKSTELMKKAGKIYEPVTYEGGSRRVFCRSCFTWNSGSACARSNRGKMINSRLTSLIRNEFIQILRDPRTLVLVLFIPVMQLFLLGYAATNDVRNVPLAVYDQDRGPAARELLDAYRAADYFQIAYDVDSEDELGDLIDSGEARVGLIIPPGYTDQIKSNGSAAVMFVLDGSDPTVASTALSAAQMIGQQHATQILVERMERSAQASELVQPVEVHTRIWYNPDLISSYFMIPGVIAMILFLSEIGPWFGSRPTPCAPSR